MNRADRIQSEFPPGVMMPPLLRGMCDLLDRTDYPISGGMRLRPEGKNLQGWFGADSDAWKMLAGFCAGPDGSTIAIWNHAACALEDAPVVHLGSEGNEIRVIADNLEQFARLFAIGYEELGFDDLRLPPEEPETAAHLRQWLKAQFGIVPPATGADIATRAKDKHPDFESWVRGAQDLRDRMEAAGQPDCRPR